MLLSTTKSYLDVSILKGYLNHKISNWYRNAKLDYDVNGRFNNITTCGEHLTIEWFEEGKPFTLEVLYFNDYTMEQIYNIWMEG